MNSNPTPKEVEFISKSLLNNAGLPGHRTDLGAVLIQIYTKQ